MVKLIDVTGKVVSGEWGNDDLVGNGIPVLRTTNFNNDGTINYDNIVTRSITKTKINDKYLLNGDILIEKSGGSDTKPVGRVVYFEGEEKKYLYNNFTGLLRIKDKKEWYPKYIFYSLYANYKRGGTKIYQNKTTGLHNLKTENYISTFCIKQIPLQEQVDICNKLNRIKNIIDKKQLQLVEYAKLTHSLFVEMFGDFVENPKCYKKEPIETHVDLLSGYPFKSSQYVDVGINICGGLIIMPQTIKWEDCLHWESTDGYEEYMLQENDIVMALDRPWISDGFKIAKVDAEHLPALLIQRTARIRAIDINQEYLYYCFIIGGFERHSSITGSLVPHISLKDIRSFQILIPPLKLQEQFADIVGKIDKHKFPILD